MTPKARDEAIRTMKDSPDVNVMIASLKAGGTGLNLQFANRMISVYVYYRLSYHHPLIIVQLSVVEFGS
jgi:hypothetical protein